MAHMEPLGELPRQPGHRRLVLRSPGGQQPPRRIQARLPGTEGPYVYIYIYMYTYAYMYLCICSSAYICIYMYIHINVYM